VSSRLSAIRRQIEILGKFHWKVGEFPYGLFLQALKCYEAGDGAPALLFLHILLTLEITDAWSVNVGPPRIIYVKACYVS